MNTEACHCPCCRQGIAAPHEYHLERRPMKVAAVLESEPCWNCNGEGFVDVSGFCDLATCEDCRGSGKAATPTPVPAAVMEAAPAVPPAGRGEPVAWLYTRTEDGRKVLAFSPNPNSAGKWLPLYAASPAGVQGDGVIDLIAASQQALLAYHAGLIGANTGVMLDSAMTGLRKAADSVAVLLSPPLPARRAGAEGGETERHVNPACGVHGPIPCEGARCICARGVTAALAPGEIIGWQWRRVCEAWPEKLLNSEPALTAPDTEKRAIYAGPTLAYGVSEARK